ncbi:MAG: GNAT family N-acetyltransferase [Pseudomonadales bacterium]
MIPGYQISTDRSAMDIAAIHSFLTGSYWAKGVPKDTVSKSIDHSLCFGIFTSAQEQVGFARAVTDSATFAYLADVYVLEPHRGKGLSKWLMQCVMDHPQLQGLRRIVLATKDAHGLYRQFGFSELANPQSLMELWAPDIYAKA